MSSPSTMCIHFGQTEAGTDMHNEPIMVNQRVYIGHKTIGDSIAPALANFLSESEILTNDEVVTAELVDYLGKKFGSETVGTGITIAPHSLPTTFPLLVLDVTNEKVWVEDRAGDIIKGREWSLDAFMALDDDEARAAMED